MIRSRQWLPLALAALVACSATAAVAADSTAPRPFAPVQRGYTTQAEITVPYATDRILVQFREFGADKSALGIPLERGAQVPGAKTGLAGVDALAAAYGVTSIERPYAPLRNAAKSADLGLDRWFMFRFATTDDMADVADAFRADANVAAVSLDWRAYPAAVPNDPLYPDQWGHDNTGQLLSYDWATHSHENGDPVGTPGFDSHAEEAWDKSQGYGSSSVVIAIIDSGVDIDHPDLRLVAGYDFGDNDTNPDDNSGNAGHGTACAGVAAAIAGNNLGVSGIAGGCSVMPLKVANKQGSMYFSAIQNALYYAADNGADIASMSLSADISSDPATDAALQYASNAGVLLLAATSNSNESHIRYPANNQHVMGIGAASPCGDRKRSAASSLYLNPGVQPDPNDYTCDGERWWGSNYGTTTPDAAGAVDLIAPTILPTTDIGGSAGYASGDYSMWFNGTSCATPYAAGCAALVLSANPGYTPAEVRQALVSSATDVVNVESGPGWDRYSGYGMVNVDAALGGGGPVAPTAEFTGAPTSGSYPLTVNFTDQSTGAPTSWSWTFGDGGTSTLQNPSHSYTEAGTYTVSLTATNAEGSSTETKNGYVTVTEPGVTTFVTADGETSVAGAVTGTFVDTGISDGVTEAVSEVLYTGHPRKTYSYAEHLWTFTLPSGGGAATFHLEASRTNNSEGDDFLFEYTIDGVNYTTLATVSSATEQSFSVPLGTLAGTVTVRATDTDRNWGNVGLDAVSVDYMAFEVGDVQPTTPTADFAGSPTSGVYPLAVQFADLSTGVPTSWSWTFGDGGTSTAQNPSHTYAAAGIYTVSLTASNAQGSDTATKTGYITVTEPGTGGATMHVADMAVSNARSGPNTLGVCTVTVVDDAGQPVDAATVSVAYVGPTGGTTSGVTTADGTVTLQSSAIKKPAGEWCFEVTGITHATLTYDAGANVVTRSCESGDVNAAMDRNVAALDFELGQNTPNPFNPATEISFSLPRALNVTLRVYDVRGQLVATLAEGAREAGRHTVLWDAREHPSGIYFYRLETPDFAETRKMIMLK